MILECTDLSLVGKPGSRFMLSVSGGDDYLFGDWNLVELFYLFCNVTTFRADRSLLLKGLVRCMPNGVFVGDIKVAPIDWFDCSLSTKVVQLDNYLLVVYSVIHDTCALLFNRFNLEFYGCVFNGEATYTSRELARFLIMYPQLDLSCSELRK